jgi:outer membrane protein TolC
MHKKLPFIALTWLAGCAPIEYYQTSCGPAEEWCPALTQVSIAPCEPEILPVPCPNRVLDLGIMIDIALQNNPDTRGTWNDARVAAAGLGVAKAPMYPTADLTETYEIGDQVFRTGGVNFTAVDNKSGQNVTTGGGRLKSYKSVESQLVLNYLLWDFGGRNASVESARELLFAADWVHNRAIQDVIFSVIDNYYLVQETKALLKAEDQDLEESQKNYEAALAQFEAGVKTKADVLQAKANLVQVQLRIVQLQGVLDTNYGKLAYAMGVPPDTRLNIVDVPKKVPTDDSMDQDVEQLITDGLMNRPDLAGAYAELLSRQADITVALSAGLPYLSANGSFLKTHYINNNIFDSHLYTGSIALNVPLFSGFLYEYQRKQAEAAADSAFENLRKKEQDIILDIVTSYYAFITAKKTVIYSEEFLDSALQNYEVAYGSYRAGVNSILDLLTAQKTLADARAARIQAIATWYRSLIHIAYSTGTINKNDSIPNKFKTREKK